MKNIIERLFKNWKTTLLGAVGAALIAGGGLLTEGETDVKVVLGAAGAALVGFVLKDPKKKEDLEKKEDEVKEEGK